MREELRLQEQPNPLHGVQLRRTGRQRFKGDVGRNAQCFRFMPSRLVENEKDMLVRGDGFGELVEIDLHGVGRDFGQNQRESVIGARLHGAIDIGEGIALIASPRRPPAPREPAMTDAAFLTNARLVLEKETDFLVRMGRANLFQAFGEPFLKASCAASSFSG